jgi:hypothetical protein
MELLKKEEVNVIENTYTLQDKTSVFYYKEFINSKGKVVDSFLRDKDGFEIDDPSLLENVQEFIDSLDLIIGTFTINKK